MTACAIAKVAALGFWSVCLLSSVAAAADIDVPRTLKGVEDRYNRTQTLQLSFTESYQQGARISSVSFNFIFSARLSCGV